jgi:hypothetical protein
MVVRGRGCQRIGNSQRFTIGGGWTFSVKFIRQPRCPMLVLRAETVTFTDGSTIEDAMVIPQDLTILIIADESVTEFSRDAIRSVRYTDERAMFFLKGMGMINLLADIEDMQEDLEEFEYQLAVVAQHFESTLETAKGQESATGNPYEVGQ